MSAPLAGKFQDHYEVLGVTPRATPEEIQRICQEQMAKYDPVMGTEPDLDKFESVKLALEILSDPDLRAQFDKLKGIKEKPPQFSGLPFFEGLGEDSRLRTAMLCVLFDRRRSNPVKPTLTMRQIEGIIQSDSDSFILAAWYLKQRGHIVVDDKSHMAITVKGIDELEANPPDPETVMAMIRPERLAGYEPPEGEEAGELAAAPEPAAAEPDRSAEMAASDETAESGLQALAGAISQDSGVSPAPAEPASVGAPVPDAPLDAGEELADESASWSVSTPLGDTSEGAGADDPSQTLGRRLQGILGRPL